VSAEILQLQTDLSALGIDPGPLDGLPGSRTRGAAHTAAQRLGVKDFTGGEIPPELVAAIHQAAEAERTPLARPARYLDLSQVSAPGWREGYRPLSEVVGVTLHQTGCPLPEVSDAEVEAYVASGALSRQTPALLRWSRHQTQIEPPRYQALKTHYGITYSGRILLIHPLEQWGWSAQSLSRSTISIEVAGFFEGVDGDPRTRPGGPASWHTQRATDAQLSACRELIRYLYRWFLGRGVTLTRCYAHRQATNDRTPDPGSRVWQGVALPLQHELGLTDGGEGYVRGRGQPIPRAWCPAYSAPY
jgi:hypothetical protein